MQEIANQLLKCVALRVIGTLTILFTCDDWDQYLPAIKAAFGYWYRPRRKAKRGRMKKKKLALPPNILYGIVRKIKNGRGQVVKTIRKIVCGSPEGIEEILQNSTVSHVLNTSFVERINGTFLTFCSRLTRKTYKFSRKAENHDAHISIITTYYNFVKPHSTLSKLFNAEMTPAVAIGITDHCFTWEELCNFCIG